MANVLPQEAQKKVISSYRARFVLVGSLALFASAVVAFLALAPAYAVVSLGGTVLSQDELQPVSPAGVQGTADREDILRAQALLRDLSPIASSTTSGQSALEAALKARPKGILVQTLSYESGKVGTITIGGTASTRGEINAYAADLRSDTRFENVSVPIGALAGTEGGRFTITLSGTF